MTSQIFTPLRLLTAERAREAVAQHLLIAEAIAAADEEAAEARAREHIRSTLDELRARLP
jgi:DNA-binding GntR family transcriptional regulator